MADGLRIGLVVHPTRPVSGALEALEWWSRDAAVDVFQVDVPGAPDRVLAPPGEVTQGDVLVALGGDGTVLAALRAAALAGAPVLGVACGSLGVLTAVQGDKVAEALERFRSGDWTARRLPALSIRANDAADAWAVNDFVVARRGAGQVQLDVSVDDELYARVAGDGLIVASPVGSSAYSMAAGGPIVASGTQVIVCTPLAMHGGNAPPLVVPASSTLRVQVTPGFGGFDVEIDGHLSPLQALDYRVSLEHDKLTLVTFGELGIGLTALRARGLIADSPRVLVRDARRARSG